MIIQEIKKKEKTFKEIYLPKYLMSCRWFAGKNKQIQEVNIIDSLEITAECALLLLDVTFTGSLVKKYWLPVCLLEESFKKKHPEALIDDTFADAIYDDTFQREILQIILNEKTIESSKGSLKAMKGKFAKNKESLFSDLTPSYFRSEQSNSSVVYEDKLFLKLYRQPSSQVNAECIQIKFLSEESDFQAIPHFAGCLEYSDFAERNNISVCALFSYVANNGNAWELTLSSIDQLFHKTSAQEISDSHQAFLKKVKQLSELTADLHVALSQSVSSQPYLETSSQKDDCLALLQATFNELKASEQQNNEAVQKLLKQETEIMSFLEKHFPEETELEPIPIHGDYHLGQILFSEANGFTIIDFEGEPGNSHKTSHTAENFALEDVAGMLRSFSYAINFYAVERPQQAEHINNLKTSWYKTVVDIFFQSYLNKTIDCSFIPKDKEKQQALLKCLLLRKAFYEVKYELNNRPIWLVIPINGIFEILNNNF